MVTTAWPRGGAAKPVQGSHVFEVSGYSLHREVLGDSLVAESAVFDVGGYYWQIHFYPGGLSEHYKDYLSVYVSLHSKNNDDTKVKASVQFSLVDVTGASPPHTVTTKLESGRNIWLTGIMDFKKTRELECSRYLRDDRLTIECVITLDRESLMVQSSAAEAPPSDLMEIEHLRKLLQAKEDADVTFEVHGEAFPAHKTVLAMRSPVFRAELYGPMREKDMSRIAIGDMQPAVFEALLHFIYTDSLPAMDDLRRDDYEDTIRHLLVAADRYAMERLKMICEGILCESIDVKTVMTTLALADQHRCGRLNDACIRFIASLGTTEMDDVMESPGYADLKLACPLAIVELWEKASSLYKSKSSFHIATSVSQIQFN